MSDNHSRLIARNVMLLVQIKAFLLKDNTVCMSATDMGNLAAAKHIDDIVKYLMSAETERADLEERYQAEKEENREYRTVFGDYTIDMLTDEEFAELKEAIGVLVEKWESADRE